MSYIDACRFFYRTAEFEAEATHYRDPVLSPLLPPCIEIYSSAHGYQHSQSGSVLPPFIVLERGMPLVEWARVGSRAACLICIRV